MKVQLIYTNHQIPYTEETNKHFLLIHENLNYMSFIYCNFMKYQRDQLTQYRTLNKKIQRRLKHKFLWET